MVCNGPAKELLYLYLYHEYYHVAPRRVKCTAYIRNSFVFFMPIHYI